MLVLANLPTSMDFVAQMIVQEKDNTGKAKDPTIVGIHTTAVLSWNQQSIQGKGKAPAYANKLSAVKPKGSNPKFQQQQQSQEDAGLSRLEPDAMPCHGTRRGTKGGRGQAQGHGNGHGNHFSGGSSHHNHQIASTATHPTTNPPTPSPTPAPSIHIPPLSTKEKKDLLLLPRFSRPSPWQTGLGGLNPHMRLFAHSMPLLPWGLSIIRQVDPILDILSHYSQSKSVHFCEKQLICWMGGHNDGNRVQVDTEIAVPVTHYIDNSNCVCNMCQRLQLNTSPKEA
jgi:hypothetical protein